MEKEKAKMTVVCQSTGEKVNLELHHVDRNQLVVIIDIPAYNARLTFTATEKWVRVASREKIDPEKEYALLHVSRSVWNRDFKGVAVWANEILHAKRPVKEVKPISRTADKEWWIIFWQAAYADFPQMLVLAGSEKEALGKARHIPALGAFGVVFDQLYAESLGLKDQQAAIREFRWLEHQAQQTQARGLASPPISEEERAELLRGLAKLKADLTARVGVLAAAGA